MQLIKIPAKLPIFVMASVIVLAAVIILLGLIDVQSSLSFKTVEAINGKLWTLFSYMAALGLLVILLSGATTVYMMRQAKADIEERKKAEQVLVENEKRLRTILESMPAGIVIIDPQDHRIVDANEPAAKLIGCEKEKIIGSVCHKFICSANIGKCPVTDLGQTVDNAERVLLTREGKQLPIIKNVVPFELDGRQMLLESFTDISERKAAELAKEVSDKNYRLLAENTSDVVGIMDTDLKFKWLSASHYKQSGYSLEEVNTLPVDRRMTIDSRNRSLTAFLEAMQLEKEGKLPPDYKIDMELEMICKDGTTIYTENRFHYLRDENNRATSILMQGRDITERKKAEDALNKTMADLKRSNEELQQFAYIASHDLQEPLRMVSSYVQLLEKRYKDKLDEDASDFINFAVCGAKRMQNLINDLLSYSRVGTRAKPFQPVQTEEVLYAAMNNLEVAIHESEARIEHGRMPEISGDEGQLTQVFQNLLGNAIKFHRAEPPQIKVDSYRRNGSWVFTVEDNGIGIDPQFHERIFIIFQRLNGNDYPGTGIGLSIARKIVQRHGGKIWLESQPGKGSKFSFEIPLVHEEGGN